MYTVPPQLSAQPRNTKGVNLVSLFLLLLPFILPTSMCVTKQREFKKKTKTPALWNGKITNVLYTLDYERHCVECVDDDEIRNVREFYAHTHTHTSLVWCECVRVCIV